MQQVIPDLPKIILPPETAPAPSELQIVLPDAPPDTRNWMQKKLDTTRDWLKGHPVPTPVKALYPWLDFGKQQVEGNLDLAAHPSERLPELGAFLATLPLGGEGAAARPALSALRAGAGYLMGKFAQDAPAIAAGRQTATDSLVSGVPGAAGTGVLQGVGERFLTGLTPARTPEAQARVAEFANVRGPQGQTPNVSAGTVLGPGQGFANATLRGLEQVASKFLGGSAITRAADAQAAPLVEAGLRRIPNVPDVVMDPQSLGAMVRQGLRSQEAAAADRVLSQQEVLNRAREAEHAAVYSGTTTAGAPNQVTNRVSGPPVGGVIPTPPTYPITVTGGGRPGTFRAGPNGFTADVPRPATPPQATSGLPVPAGPQGASSPLASFRPGGGGFAAEVADTRVPLPNRDAADLHKAIDAKYDALTKAVAEPTGVLHPDEKAVVSKLFNDAPETVLEALGRKSLSAVQRINTALTPAQRKTFANAFLDRHILTDGAGGSDLAGVLGRLQEAKQSGVLKALLPEKQGAEMIARLEALASIASGIKTPTTSFTQALKTGSGLGTLATGALSSELSPQKQGFLSHVATSEGVMGLTTALLRAPQTRQLFLQGLTDANGARAAASIIRALHLAQQQQISDILR